MSAPVVAKHNISKKRKFVADGVFYAELREFLSKELAEDGFSGVEVRKTPIRTEIIIRATRTMEVLGPNGRRIRELTSLVQKRFGFTEGTVRRPAPPLARPQPPTSSSPLAPPSFLSGRALRRACQQPWLERVQPGREPQVQARAGAPSPPVLPARQTARSFLTSPPRLLTNQPQGLAVRRACYSVLRYIMENGAKGAQVTRCSAEALQAFGCCSRAAGDCEGQGPRAACQGHEVR